ncbi:MAG: hypothetical protein DWQ47_11805 [Acidobacteria bacterium]|nr:MAG: hypothetical protein DWQ32_14220 [Acidobacteriota bacterium]REJ98256.1 MAG: hypothetical protein DWQ38_17020 [Acidobacteriota bacterium]REK17000.1 MAG: hypothetical protein DWQ43_02065 [Acidobacteriota bacterium]REK42910.1 MAG: hypothetical protein DWQ47_11805 [Acidobacteriota bacterium]
MTEKTNTKIVNFWIRTIYKLIINRTAKKVLTGRLRSIDDAEVGRFTKEDSKLILRDTWGRYDEISGSVPNEVNLGGRINILLACLTLCTFRSLVDQGIERSYAVALVADITWNAYRKWGKIAILIGRSLTRDKTRQLQIAVGSFLKFPFSPPTYQIESLPNSEGIDLRVTRCPIEEYFDKNDATDLCRESWCNLDFALAEMWGAILERDRTLALGFKFCDFKFKTKSKYSDN